MKKTSNLILAALAVVLSAGIFFSGCSKKEETSKKSKKSGKKTEKTIDETEDETEDTEEPEQTEKPDQTDTTPEESTDGSSATDETSALDIGEMEPYDAGMDYLYGAHGKDFSLSDARQAFQMAADAGDGRGYFGLGLIERDRSLEAGHYQKAMEYFEKAIEMNCPEGLCGKASLYESAWGVEYDVDLAFSLYQQAAEQGCAFGTTGMGQMYRTGMSGFGTPDPEKSLEYYQKAIESDDWYAAMYATNAIGNLYSSGCGTQPQDFAKALEWYQKAIDGDYTPAIFNTGRRYNAGEGVPQDPAKAQEYFTEAAGRGHADAACEMGWAYEKGIGVDADPKKAEQWYKLSCELGSRTGVFDLGCLYLYNKDIAPDYDLMLNCFEIAAQEGYGAAFGRLGYIYSEGIGVPKDDVKAVEWWTKGVKESDSTSASNMGWASQYGKGGVRQDYEAALDYYAMAIYFTYYDGNTTTEEYARNAIEDMVTEGKVTREQADAALQKISDLLG